MIDPLDSTLYRSLKSGDEEAMPIHGNEDMNRFMCFDKRSFLKAVLKEIEEDAK